MDSTRTVHCTLWTVHEKYTVHCGQYTNSTLYTVNNTRTVHKITFNTTIFLRRVIDFFYLNSKNPNNTEST